MTSSLIIILELGLLSLLLLLAFRVLSLNRSEPLASAMPSEARAPGNPLSVLTTTRPDSAEFYTPPPRPGVAMPPLGKCELISQLHILASLQDLDCRHQGYDLQAAHQTVREYAVCWLYGAAAELGRAHGRSSGQLDALVSQFASRKLGIRQSDALGVISALTRQSASLACFRSGIEGAEFWKTHHYIPREKSLFQAITSNTFV